MANGTKGVVKTAAPPLASHAAPPSIGTAQNATGKKKKRNQRTAERAATQADMEVVAAGYHQPHAGPAKHTGHQHQPSPDLDDDPDETDSEDEFSPISAQPSAPTLNGHVESNGTKKKNKKKKKNKGSAQPADEWNGYDGGPSQYPGYHHSGKQDRIWNTSSHEERQRIKDFWGSLSESDRKSLLKVEKETVLKSMKEQQKHSCSCTVCGRKRNAVEEELEGLYDEYYAELEQYAVQQARSRGSELPFPLDMADQANRIRQQLQHTPYPTRPPRRDEASDEEEYGEDEEDDDDLYSEDGSYSRDGHGPHPVAGDLRLFGNQLEINGNMLTVADDIIRNDGKKFIDMIEQLAERRLQQEQSVNHPGYYEHEQLQDDEEEEFEDDEECDEDEYTPEEEQEIRNGPDRREEGRRMFQIFAARLFEQRLINAYRQRVADERQRKLLEELEDEKTNDAQREAKKQRDAQKKKEKKDKVKQAKAEEKARKEAEKRAEENAARAAEEAAKEEQRKRREEARKKKEAERKAVEDEKQRKELERVRRQQEERERQQEAERKARDAKAADKKARDDQKRKEREDREAKEREAKERKVHAERQRKELEEQKARNKAGRDAHDRAERERVERAKRDAAAQAAARRIAQQAAVALPPGLPRNPSNLSSPHVAIATPAIPKAPTPVRARPGSRPESKTSSPKTPQLPGGPMKAISPIEGSFLHGISVRKTTNAKGMPLSHAPMLPHPATLPPGMNIPPGFGMQSPMNGFPQSPGPISANRTPNPNVFLPHGATPGAFRSPGPMGPAVVPGMSRMFSDQGLPPTHPPPGFGLPLSHASSHARQASGSSSSFDAAPGPPGAPPGQRPAPIQRPGSVKPFDDLRSTGLDFDELSSHLGSSALLDDSDEPMPGNMGRLPSLGARATSNMSAFNMFNAPTGGQRMDTFAGLGPASSNPSSAWSSPPSNLAFGTGTTAMSPAPQSTWASPAPSTWGGIMPKMPFSNPLHSLGAGGGAGIGLHHHAHHHHHHHHVHGRTSHLQTRVRIVSFFKNLANNPAMAGVPVTQDGFVEVVYVMSALDLKNTTGVQDVLDLCDTEGNAQNGGGTFILVKNTLVLEKSLVKWEGPLAGNGLLRDFDGTQQQQQQRATAGVGGVMNPPPGMGNPLSAGVLGEIGGAAGGGVQAPPGLFPGLGYS